MVRASFHRFAEAELNDAAAHYETQQSGLGARFLAAVDACIDAIVQQPQAAPIILGSARLRLVSRFPYAVIYAIEPEGVRVLAIMNLKRRPLYWVGRS